MYANQPFVHGILMNTSLLWCGERHFSRYVRSLAFCLWDLNENGSPPVRRATGIRLCVEDGQLSASLARDEVV